MRFLAAYIVSLLIFGTIDATWLTTMGPVLYRPVLAEMLAPAVRIAPAIAFYAIFPIGIVSFGVLPALRANSVLTAFLLAFLFGAIAYATYDLTNYATLKNWTLMITAIDIAYGALTSGIASSGAFLAVRLIPGWFEDIRL